MSLVTPGEVKSFMEDAFKALANSAGGYSSFEVKATGYSRNKGACKVEFVAYNRYVGHSPECDNPAEAVEYIRKNSKKKSASQLLHDRAKEMMAEADELASLGK